VPQLLVAQQSGDATLDSYRLLEEAPDPRRRLRQGEVWISQPFARKHSLQVGQSLAIDSPEGRISLPVAAIFVDFSTIRGMCWPI